MLRYVLLLSLIGCSGCPHNPTPTPVPPTPIVDAAAVDTGPLPHTCSGYCIHLRALGCPAGAPTPKGVSCEDVCQNLQDSGVVTYDLGCRTSASTCASIDSCEASR
jgi:hypothetical protein